MRFLVQRVTRASVTINDNITAQIGTGLVVLMGIHKDDTTALCEKYVQKLLRLRIFADTIKPINASVMDIGGEILIISQFTLYGDCKGQNRPSFKDVARPEIARPIYDEFVRLCQAAWPKTHTGEFAADMLVELVNDGPVTVLVE